MTNADIDRFFKDSDLEGSFERVEHNPNVLWAFKVGRRQALIQTQESANRMRIVVFIGDASQLDRNELYRLLEANYHTALDSRYGIADNQLVSTFIHPLQELTNTQFVMGLFQAISCAETCGSHYSGGTMVFGHGAGTAAEQAELSIHQLLKETISKIRRF